MSTIVTRAGKGSPLTNNEIDSNFTNLNTDKLEDGDLSVVTNSAGTAALSYTSGVFTYTPPDLSGYAALSGATFTGEVEATGFNGDLTGAILFKGQAGEALTKGDPVYISGISGNTTIVSKADADDASKMPCFGIVDATVNANAACSVVTFGTLQGLDTSSFSEGDELFVSATGTLTTTAPTGESALLQKIAKVTKSHASSGSIKVSGAGRTNATPNLDDGNFFLGNGSNQAVSADFSTSVTNIALPLSGGALTGAVTTNSTFDGRDVATDGAKLDGIEASADVTDTANVTAAGALMDSELTSIASVKALNQGVATTDSPTFAGIDVTSTATMDYLTVGNAGSDYALKIKEGSGDEYYQLGVDSYGGLVFYNETTKVAEFTDASTFVTQGDITVHGTASMDGLTVDGYVGIGTNTPSSYFSPQLVVHSSSNLGGITIRSNATTDTNYLLFADGTSGNERYRGYVSYDHNADTMKLATGASPAITIDSSQKVGIGITSPLSVASGYGALTVGGSTGGGIILSDTSSGHGQVYANSSQLTVDAFSSRNLTFQTNGSERMRIDSAGNVGIGESSPAQKIHLRTSGVNTGARLQVAGGSGRAYDILSTTDGSLTITDANASAERMRLDSSGNLLIGKTTTGVSGAGVVLRGGGELFVTRAGDVMNLNRLGSDGEIAAFRKDGASVGSLKADAGSLGIGSGNCGLLFYDAGDRIIPRNGTSTSDGSLDLGYNTDRFKDLYLSGTVRGGVETAVTSTSTTITSGTHLYVSAAGQTITLPASPSQGAKAHITVGNFTDTVVARNGSNIMGDASDMTLDKAYLSIQFIYVDATRGWVMA